MKKTLSLWLIAGLVACAATGLVGCSGGDDAPGSNQELIDKYNKDLPPVDPNAPLPEEPTRSGMPNTKGKG